MLEHIVVGGGQRGVAQQLLNVAKFHAGLVAVAKARGDSAAQRFGLGLQPGAHAHVGDQPIDLPGAQLKHIRSGSAESIFEPVGAK